eukprot:7376558-Prymnesium_polylepis.1
MTLWITCAARWPRARSSQPTRGCTCKCWRTSGTSATCRRRLLPCSARSSASRATRSRSAGTSSLVVASVPRVRGTAHRARRIRRSRQDGGDRSLQRLAASGAWLATGLTGRHERSGGAFTLGPEWQADGRTSTYFFTAMRRGVEAADAAARRRPLALQRRRGSSLWVSSPDERRVENGMEM